MVTTSFTPHEKAFPVEICGCATGREILAHFRSHMATQWRPAAIFVRLVELSIISSKGLLPRIILSMNKGFLLRFDLAQPLLKFWHTFGLIWPHSGDL